MAMDPIAREKSVTIEIFLVVFKPQTIGYIFSLVLPLTIPKRREPQQKRPRPHTCLVLEGEESFISCLELPS